MEQRRTDLALEARELWQERAGETSQLEGVEARTGEREGFRSETVHILDERGEQALGKPAGTYVTLTMDGLQRREEDAFGRGARAVAGVLRELMGPEGEKGGALVVGLGNRAITPDAIGPKVHEYTLVTRHLVEGVPEHFGSFRPVASLAAGVLGTTGMESGELVQAVCRSLKPAWVIAVDALASRSLERLCRTVQISDTGIVPGSGVGNARMALDEEHLGLPVLAVGVPTVVEAGTLCLDLLEEAGSDREGSEPSRQFGQGSAWFVTPRNIDSEVEVLSKILGLGISAALHVDISVEDVENLVG